MDAINGIHIGLHQNKIISLGIQGQIKLEDHVKALHVYVDEMDVLIAKTMSDGLLQNPTQWRSQSPTEHPHETGSRNGFSSQHKRAQECMSEHTEHVGINL